MMWNARWLVFNEAEMCFILSWFGVHQYILHSWGDFRVLLFLWQCSWGFSSVPSGKSRFLTSLIGNTELLRMKCRGIGPHLGKLNYAWQENTHASGGEPGSQVSLISWHSYIGIPVNFHEVSGIVTFWSIELIAPLEVSNGCEAICPEEVEDYGFLYGLHRGFSHPFIWWDEIWACI